MFERKNTTKYYVHNLILCIINKESELTTAPNPTLNPQHTGATELMAAAPFPTDTLPCKNKNYVTNIIR